MYKLLVTLVTVLSGLALSAADIRQFSEHEGLPNRQVYGLQADCNGFVWIYTPSGIGRYDGREFRTYHLDYVDPSRDNIQSATALSLTPDGQLCISLKSGQVFVYDRTLDLFEKVFDFQDRDLDNIRIYNVVFSDGTMALCTSDGIYALTGSGIYRPALAGKTVYDLMNVGGKTWYASADDGLYKIDMTVRKDNSRDFNASIIPGSEGKNFRSMKQSHSKIFAGSFANGVYVIDNDTARRLNFIDLNMPVNKIARADDNTLLVGIDGAGVYRIDPQSEQIIGRYAYNGTGSGLSANTISDICTDSDGGIWIGTTTHGINYIPRKDSEVSVTTHEYRNPNSLASDYVITIFEDSDGDLWYGTDAGVSMEGRDGSWHHYLKSPGGSDNSILTITQSDDGIIWAGGYGSGAWKIDKNTGSVVHMPIRNGDRGVGTEYLFEIFADGDNIWFGGIEGDITRYDRSDDSWHYYPAECVGDMAYGPGNRLYMAGCGGIGIYDADADTINWMHQIGDLVIKHPTRYLLYDQERDEMWFASDGDGVIRYCPRSGKAGSFDTAGKVTSSSIDGIVQDKSGKIWFITEYDIYYIDPQTQTVNRITSALDLDKTSFLPGAIYLRSDGDLVIGSTDGAIAIDPLQDYSHINAPRLIFTDLFVNQERIAPGPGNRLEKSVDLAGRIILKHNENSFSITFSSISFTNSRRIAYRWKLEGYDSEYRTADNATEAIYRKIPYGDYTFHLQAIDSLTDEILSEREIDIIVRPPLWLTWWAKTLYVILILFIGWFVYKFLRRRQRERRITDRLTSFLNLIHDLRTPVTLIKAPLSEIETQTGLPEDTKKNVHLAMSNVERLLSMISRLLDLRRESQHSDCLNLQETDVKDFLESKAAEYRVAAMHKGLALDVSVAGDMPPVMMDCNKISHIIDNLLSNAIKYTFSGSVALRASFDRKHWTLEISDTGIGIPSRDHNRLFQNQYRGANAVATDEIGSGMGLLIVHRLCGLHKGRIRVTSKEDRGTTFTLTFPLNIRVPARKLPPAQYGAEDTPIDIGQDNGKETVVLIDDDKDIRDYLADALSATYNIVRFSDATDALCQISAINPDIVISDVKLHGMSGFELCQKLKGSVETSHIPVILLSALGERQNIILGLEAGANDYVVKPFDISVLRLRIRNILNSRRQLRESFIDDALQTPGDTPLISELDREFMDKVRAILDQNIADSEYSISNLCRDLAMSRTTVYNKIKALSGESINEFIRIRRLNKGKELLATRRYSISEVAYMVGFSDPKYFSTCFKKQFGTSPSKI